MIYVCSCIYIKMANTNTNTSMNTNKSNNSNKTHTTVAIDVELYKKFCMKVIEKFGTRRNNDVIVRLIEDWVFDKKK